MCSRARVRVCEKVMLFVRRLEFDSIFGNRYFFLYVINKRQTADNHEIEEEVATAAMAEFAFTKSDGICSI